MVFLVEDKGTHGEDSSTFATRQERWGMAVLDNPRWTVPLKKGGIGEGVR